MGGVRDTDPLEQEIIDRLGLPLVTVDDIRKLSARIPEEMDRLSGLVDKIYVHVDMDVLDPAEVPGHTLNVPDGPTSVELAAAIELMFTYEKTSAIGIASAPVHDDPDKVSLHAAYNLIEGAVRGVRKR